MGKISPAGLELPTGRKNIMYEIRIKEGGGFSGRKLK